MSTPLHLATHSPMTPTRKSLGVLRWEDTCALDRDSISDLPSGLGKGLSQPVLPAVETPSGVDGRYNFSTFTASGSPVAGKGPACRPSSDWAVIFNLNP